MSCLSGPLQPHHPWIIVGLVLAVGALAFLAGAAAQAGWAWVARRKP